MNFEIQALGGKLIGSRSAMKTLDRLTSLLPNAKIIVEVLPPPETKKAEFGSMPDFRDPVPETDSDEDDDDIMHDPDIQEMVKNGEHTCHMFDTHCQACEDDEEDEDEDDITLADLKEQLEDNMTLRSEEHPSELQSQSTTSYDVLCSTKTITKVRAAFS